MDTPSTLSMVKRDSGSPTTDVPDLPRLPATLSTHTKVFNMLKSVLDFLILQWFILGIGTVIALASAFPNVVSVDILRRRRFPSGQKAQADILTCLQGREGGIVKAQYTVKYLLVALIFFFSGLTLPGLHLVSLHYRIISFYI